jgi:hypothetical protein
MPHSLRVVENSAMLSHKHMKVQLTFIDVEGYKSHAVVREWVTQVKRIISTQVQPIPNLIVPRPLAQIETALLQQGSISNIA